jgi:hypothetical protein
MMETVKTLGNWANREPTPEEITFVVEQMRKDWEWLAADRAYFAWLLNHWTPIVYPYWLIPVKMLLCRHHQVSEYRAERRHVVKCDRCGKYLIDER